LSIDNKYIFVFALTVFFILSITGAGLFLNDEWFPAQQLHQLSQGHQIFTNEGKYGYYDNGTASPYMEMRANILIYSAALPIVSLPTHLLFTLVLSTAYTRLAILFFWFALGLFIWYYISIHIKSDIINIIIFILLTLSFAISQSIITPFPMSGQFAPSEIISIAFTNILILGIFSVAAFKISEFIFEDKYKQIVGWIASLSCSSLLFWAGTLKDHMLLSTIIILLCYTQLYYIKYRDTRYEIYTFLLAGLSTWIRPEVGLPVIIALILFNLYYIRHDLIHFVQMCFWIGIGTIPMFLNNLITTGNIFIHPFLSGNTYTATSGSMINEMLLSTTKIPYALQISDPQSIMMLIFAPTNGSISIAVPLCLFIFSLAVYIKYRPKISTESKLLLVIGISSIIYYILYAGAYLGKDGGVIPDIRYFTPAYALFSIFALSIIPFDLNYKNVIRNICIATPILIITYLFIISINVSIGATFKTFRLVPNLFATLTLALLILILINYKGIKLKILEKVIPAVIAIPFAWQVIMIFIYHSTKAHSYPMFIPVVELMYKLLFVS
jgi:hypothetical protein